VVMIVAVATWVTMKMPETRPVYDVGVIADVAVVTALVYVAHYATHASRALRTEADRARALARCALVRCGMLATKMGAALLTVLGPTDRPYPQRMPTLIHQPLAEPPFREIPVACRLPTTLHAETLRR
jgi:hypothetical protein